MRKAMGNLPICNAKSVLLVYPSHCMTCVEITALSTNTSVSHNACGKEVFNEV